MSPADYEYLRNLLRQRSGLVLSADKQYLLESRLLPITRQIGAAGLGELVQHLKTSREEALIVEIIEAMTTNESFFFRDKLPFDHFRDLVIQNCWRHASASAASASGAQPLPPARSRTRLPCA